MKRLFIICYLISLSLLSCSKVSPEIVNEQNDHTIPIKEATQTLINTLNDLQPATKSKQIKIESVEVVSSSDIYNHITKTANLDIDKLLYIFNFDNNSGYAIVAADNRIPDPVLMIADVGNITKEIFKAISDCSFIYNLIGDYAVVFTDSPSDNTPSDDNASFDGSESDSSGSSSGNISGVIGNVSPMLQSIMHQSEPYNLSCPEIEPDTRAPAGCIPIAMAQIFYYFQYPHVNDDLNIPFSSTFSEDTTDAYNLYELIYNIGIQTDVMYDKDGSGTTMAKAKTAMEEYYAYEDVTKYNLYRENIILDMISEHKPVLIGASNQWIGGVGHAWVIDGYMHSPTAGHLLHCNMGWGGPGNGYYASGVFDVTSGIAPYYPDNTTNINPGEENKDYAYHYRFLDYNRPR